MIAFSSPFLLALTALCMVAGSANIEASYPKYYDSAKTVTVTKYIVSCPTGGYQPLKPEPQPTGNPSVPTYPIQKPKEPMYTQEPEKPQKPDYPQYPESGSSIDQRTTEMLCRVNKLRSQGGKKPLKIDARLMKASQKHSEDQNQNKKMSHTGTKISSFSDRIKAEGYKWTGASENVAWNQKNIEHVMKSWRNSSGHYKNIMGDFECFGWGEKNLYWTQNFAKGDACTNTVIPNCPSY